MVVCMAHGFRVPEILTVHNQYPVIVFKIIGDQLPGNMVDFNSVRSCIFQGTMVGAVTGIVVAGGTGVRMKSILQPTGVDLMNKQRFGQRRSADIAQANKEYAHRF